MLDLAKCLGFLARGINEIYSTHIPGTLKLILLSYDIKKLKLYGFFRSRILWTNPTLTIGIMLKI
jgi:hypothetical protein